MKATSGMPWAEEGLSHLSVHRATTTGADRLGSAISEAWAWLGPEIEPAPPGMRRHQADLRLRVSDRPSMMIFRKAAYVDLGPLQSLGDAWEVEVGWRASTLAPLFPVFSGRIVARGEEISLSGWYAPPGGELGRLADRALLHIAATGTAGWLLGELDRAAQLRAD
jgi:hypothetical protein